MKRLCGLCLAIGTFLSTEAAAQVNSELWKDKWYWGAQSGVFVFSTPTQSTEAALDVGGHWLITRDRVAMHLAVDQLFFSDGTTSAVADRFDASGVRTVSFSSGRRLQGELYAIPNDGNPQVFAGGGLAIQQVTDAEPVGTFTSQQQADAVNAIIDEVSTKAFFVFTAGAQLHSGRWAIYGKYQFMPEGRDFLITSEQHAITGGVRYALGSSGADITTRRR